MLRAPFIFERHFIHLRDAFYISVTFLCAECKTWDLLSSSYRARGPPADHLRVTQTRTREKVKAETPKYKEATAWLSFRKKFSLLSAGGGRQPTSHWAEPGHRKCLRANGHGRNCWLQRAPRWTWASFLQQNGFPARWNNDFKLKTHQLVSHCHYVIWIGYANRVINFQQP